MLRLKKRLLDHPFYRAWSEGKLSEKDLAVYASEYEFFIRDFLPEAWKLVGREDVAREEKEHADMWRTFGEGVGYSPSPSPKTEAMGELLSMLNSDREQLIGILYAFEVQQPEVSCTKFEGLNRWYDLPEPSKEYFRLHSETEEVDILEGLMRAMTQDEMRRCEEAFRRAEGLLWDLLTQIQRIAS